MYLDTADHSAEEGGDPVPSTETFEGGQNNGWMNAKFIHDPVYGSLLGPYQGGQLIAKSYELLDERTTDVNITFYVVKKGDWKQGVDKISIFVNNERRFSVWEEIGPDISASGMSGGALEQQRLQIDGVDMNTISITIPKSDFHDNKCHLKILFDGEITYAIQKVDFISHNSRRLHQTSSTKKAVESQEEPASRYLSRSGPTKKKKKKHNSRTQSSSHGSTEDSSRDIRKKIRSELEAAIEEELNSKILLSSVFPPGHCLHGKDTEAEVTLIPKKTWENALPKCSSTAVDK
eukprot:CAMPEP_0202446086 /NCGR_PEP_ID=MMETSP1360-20130828/4719_1 /ASSEMBLY_ACC=CAM_ASM_000848 /TAXON_ID=515479 /ORGANISM="Licmophora paradoxa, Strain CCMP2313" /LENGTH=290 /DNA_ID=CAMNT_0049062515 /DNA_START=401 /DNA_END=1274 /DNA_ORIENTATION=-